MPPPELPEIAVIAPDGTQGSVPAAQLSDPAALDEFIKSGFRFKTPALFNQEDIEHTNGVPHLRVVNANGEAGSIPASELSSPDALKELQRQGFTPASKASQLQAHQERVQSELPNLNPRNERAATQQHEHDDVFGENNTFLMLTPNGESISVPAAKAPELKASGFKFIDPKFDALVDANMQHQKERKNAITSIGHGLLSGLNTASFGLVNKSFESDLTDPDSSHFHRAAVIAHLAQSPTLYSTENTVGAIAGIAAQAATGGAAGELAAGARAGRAVEGLVAGAEEGSALRQAAAWTAGKLAEGAVISTPQAAANLIIDQDPAKAAETLALGAGLNTLLGLGGKLVSAAGPKLLEAKASAIDSFFQSAGQDASKLGSAEQKLSLVNQLAEHGAGMSETKTLEALKSVGDGAALKGVLEKVETALPEKLTAQGLSAKIEAFTTSELAKVADSPAREALEKEITATSQTAKESLSSLAATDGTISLSNAQQVVSDIGSTINKKTDPFVANLKTGIKNTLMDTVYAAVPASSLDAKLQAAFANGQFSQQTASKMFADLIDKAATEPETFNLLGKGLQKLLKSAASGAATAVGHHVVPVAGGFAGHKAGEKIGHVIDNYLFNPENPSKLTSWLQKGVSSPSLSSYVVLDAAHALQAQIDKIPAFMRTLTTKTSTNVFGAPNDAPIKGFLGAKANGLSKAQQFDAVSKQLSLLVGNPDVRQAHITGIASPYSDSHPQLAQALQNDYERKLQYIHSIMPKDPGTPQPFQAKNDWRPSTADMHEFSQQLKVAHDPFALLESLKDGSITPKQVATASTLNPQILGAIRERIRAEAFSGEHNLTFQQRLNTSVLMGEAMDVSLHNVQQLQSIYSAPASAAPQPPPKKHKGSSQHVNSKLPNAQPTPAQRISQ